MKTNWLENKKDLWSQIWEQVRWQTEERVWIHIWGRVGDHVWKKHR